MRVPRQPRIDAPDTLHHVTTRAVNRVLLFRDDADYAAYVQFLGVTCDRHGLACIAYCLMPNHVHLVVRTANGHLSGAMQYLGAAYARRHHQRYRSSGHVFQGRFDSMQVNRDAYLLEVVRYVLLNPVRGGLARTAPDWRWSSAREALALRPAREWMDFTLIYGLLGSGDGQHVNRLTRLLAAGERRPADAVDHRARVAVRTH